VWRGWARREEALSRGGGVTSVVIRHDDRECAGGCVIVVGSLIDERGKVLNDGCSDIRWKCKPQAIRSGQRRR